MSGGMPEGAGAEGAPPEGAAPVDAPTPDRVKKRPSGAVLGIIGGSVALVVGIGVLTAIALSRQAAVLTAEETVELYLTALAESDAEEALSYLSSLAVDPDDPQMLTGEMLEYSNALAAIDDIEVGEPTEPDENGLVLVPVEFTVGGEPVSREFRVSEWEGAWEILDGTIRIPRMFDGMGYTVDGVEPSDSAVSAFPGVHQFEVSSERVAIDGESVRMLIDGTDVSDLYSMELMLTEQGETEFRDLVNASFSECLAMKTITTPCGMNVDDVQLQGGYSPIEGTVTRTLTSAGAADLENREVTLHDDGTVWATMISLDVDITLEGERGGDRALFEVLWGASVDHPTVDFTAENPVVDWG